MQFFYLDFKTKEKILWFKYKKFQKTNRPSKLPKYLHSEEKKYLYQVFNQTFFCRIRNDDNDHQRGEGVRAQSPQPERQPQPPDLLQALRRYVQGKGSRK